MKENNNKIERADSNSQAMEFLKEDFAQCLEQARYYDSQIVGIFKFLATFYATIGGIAIGLYQFCFEKNINLRCALIIGLSVGFLFGILMFFLVIRNRVYFVVCMRYINETRGRFLSFKPLGFENKSRMYTNHTQPPFFNWMSSQAWWMYVIAFLNSILGGGILFFMKQGIFSISICGILLFITQLTIGIIYLISKEHKSASKAVFGEN